MSLEMKYFVLKPRSKHAGDRFAAASREAMLKYADLIEADDPSLAYEIRVWVMKEREHNKKLIEEALNKVS